MAKNPQDRTPGVAALMEKLGGRLLHLFYALGHSDIVGVIDLPDATAAAPAIVIPRDESFWKPAEPLMLLYSRHYRSSSMREEAA